MRCAIEKYGQCSISLKVFVYLMCDYQCDPVLLFTLQCYRKVVIVCVEKQCGFRALAECGICGCLQAVFQCSFWVFTGSVSV